MSRYRGSIRAAANLFALVLAGALAGGIVTNPPRELREDRARTVCDAHPAVPSDFLSPWLKEDNSMSVLPHRPATGRAFTAHVVGGGPMGLLAAIELTCLAISMDLEARCIIYEAAAYGGGPDDGTSAPRSQNWLHWDGHLYALTQPHVALSLQHSTRRLRALCPDAFTYPLALAIEPCGEGPSLADCFRALGVWHAPVPLAAVQAWFPQLRLADARAIFRVRDAKIDLRLLARGLTRLARRLGVVLVRQRVVNLVRRNDQVRLLVLADGRRVTINPHDVVALACSSTARPILADIGVAVPGLQVVCSHLLATTATQLPALLAVSRGGPNCVPHDEDGRELWNVFGNSYRTVCPPESDGRPLAIDEDAVARIRRDIADWFGIQLPADCLAWPARKTEIIPAGEGRSQTHHCLRVLGNTFLVLPGKLSQAAAAGQHLARILVRDRGTDAVARPIWERTPDGRESEESASVRPVPGLRRRLVAAAALAVAAGTLTAAGSYLF